MNIKFFKYNCFNKNEVERPVPGMPIFDQDQFCDMARLTIFGHDHRHQNYKDQIYYNGSYSRNVHGEEDAKGFLLSYISDDEIDVNHIENELALTFHTAFLHKVVEGELDYEKCVKAINALKKEVDFLKIKIDKATVMEYPTMVELIVSLFNTQLKRGIMIESPTFTRKDGELVLLAEDMNSDSDTPSVREDSKYSFLFDEGNVDDKILKYLEIKHGDKLVDDMSIDEVRLAISEIDKE